MVPVTAIQNGPTLVDWNTDRTSQPQAGASEPRAGGTPPMRAALGWPCLSLKKFLPAKAGVISTRLSEEQLRVLEKARVEKEAWGEIETHHPGYLGSQDTYYVGTLKGVGRIYQQTFIDTYCKVAFAKICDRKKALGAADFLNDWVIPWYDKHDVRLLRILTDRCTEYCGNREYHEYQLYLAIEDIDYFKTQAQSPQPMTSVSGSTAPFKTNFMSWRSEKNLPQLGNIAGGSGPVA